MLNVTPINFKHANELLTQPINALIVGEKSFAIRLPGYLNLAEITQLVELDRAKIYVAVNGIFFDHQKTSLEKYLVSLSEIGVNSIIFSDMMVYQIIKKQQLNLQLIYSTETTITNSFFSEYYASIGVNTIDLAKEITYAEITEICQLKKGKVAVNIHGHIYMYHSLRPLLEDYKNVSTIDFNNESSELFLYDEERKAYYPIVEDTQGTHILSSNDLCMIRHLDKLLTAEIDEFKIDGFGYTASEINQLTAIYIAAINDFTTDPQLYQANKNNYFQKIKALNNYKKYSTGFYFKETTY